MGHRARPLAGRPHRLDQAPHNEVFVRNTNYLCSTKEYGFVSAQFSRLRNECAWWLFTIWSNGSRKIDPAMLTWWGRALATLATERAAFTNIAADMSVADFDPDVVVREALREFHARNNRHPSPGNTRNLSSAAFNPLLRDCPVLRHPVVGPRHLGLAPRPANPPQRPRTARRPNHNSGRHRA